MQFPVMHFTFQPGKEGPISHLIKKDDRDVDCSIKRKYGNVPRATVAFIVPPPLDLSFHYEGGSRSLRATPVDAAPNASGPTEATISLVCFECLSTTSLKMEPCRNADVVSAAGPFMWSP
jgi:hypothetical protein